jgi:hypothetical protein
VAQSLAQSGRERSAIPSPDGRDAGQEIGVERDPHALRRQQSLEPIDHPGPLLLDRFPQAMDVARIFLGDTRHADDVPDTALPVAVALEQAQEPDQIEPVRLRAARPSIHFDTRRVHHVIHESLRPQIAM